MASGAINAKDVNLKFFEPGHSFMAADATHSKLEKALKQKQGKIFDFNDLVDTFVSTNCEVIQLNINDFADWESAVSQYFLKQAGDKRPYLAQMCWIRFHRDVNNGEQLQSMSFKTSFEQEEFQAFSYWKKKFDFVQKMDFRVNPRGIQKKKKEEIVTKLVPLMPINRRDFWLSLPESDKILDLASVSDEQNF